MKTTDYSEVALTVAEEIFSRLKIRPTHDALAVAVREIAQALEKAYRRGERATRVKGV